MASRGGARKADAKEAKEFLPRIPNGRAVGRKTDEELDDWDRMVLLMQPKPKADPKRAKDTTPPPRTPRKVVPRFSVFTPRLRPPFVTPKPPEGDGGHSRSRVYKNSSTLSLSHSSGNPTADTKPDIPTNPQAVSWTTASWKDASPRRIVIKKFNERRSTPISVITATDIS